MFGGSDKTPYQLLIERAAAAALNAGTNYNGLQTSNGPASQTPLLAGLLGSLASASQPAATVEAPAAPVAPPDANPAVQNFMSWITTAFPGSFNGAGGNGTTAGGGDGASLPGGAGSSALYAPGKPAQAPSMLANNPSMLKASADPVAVPAMSDGSRDNIKRPRDDVEVQHLVEKVQRRLHQNRESARKCRQRKKQYMNQLEEQLSELRRKKAEEAATQADTSAVLGQVLASPLPEAVEVASGPIAALLAWASEYHEAVRQLSAAEASGSEARLKQQLDLCVELQKQQKVLVEDFIKKDMFTALSGTHMFPEHRLLLWMGGLRPSQMLGVSLEQLAARGLLSDAERESCARLRESWFHQEQAMQTGFEQLKGAIITVNDDPADGGSVSPQMLGKMDAMRLLLFRAEELRQSCSDELRNTLTTRQYAVSLTTHMGIMDQLRLLRGMA